MFLLLIRLWVLGVFFLLLERALMTATEKKTAANTECEVLCNVKIGSLNTIEFPL